MTRVYYDKSNKRTQHACWFGSNPKGILTGTAIVACEGGANDWAAYIGGLSGLITEPSLVEHVRRYGEKLDGEMAARIFPEFVALGLTYRP
jgi:hypothetical protein